MSEMTLQFIDNNSIINRTDAISKLAWVLAVVILTFQFNTNEARALMLGALLFVAIFLARVPLITIIRTSPLIFGIALLLGLFHFFITPGEPIFVLGPLHGSAAGLTKGLGYFFRLATMVMVSFMLIWTTNIHELMVGLVKLGMPYRFAFAIFMALRFLPIVQREVDAVKAAHAIRGRASRSPFQHRFRLVATLSVHRDRQWAAQSREHGIGSRIARLWRVSRPHFCQALPLDVFRHLYGVALHRLRAGAYPVGTRHVACVVTTSVVCTLSVTAPALPSRTGALAARTVAGGAREVATTNL